MRIDLNREREMDKFIDEVNLNWIGERILFQEFPLSQLTNAQFSQSLSSSLPLIPPIFIYNIPSN